MPNCKKCSAELPDGWRWKTCGKCCTAKQAETRALTKARPRQFRGAGKGPNDVALAIVWPDEFGPEFSGLASDEERRFVYAYVASGGRSSDAAMAAYKCSTDAHAKTNASRCLQRERIQNAILAHSKVALRQLAPLVVNSLKALLLDSWHRDHLKAVRTVLERTDQVISKSEIDVTHKLSPDDQALSLLKYLLSVSAGPQALEAAFGASLPRYMLLLEPPKAIEGELA